MKATDLLKHQHEEVKELFEQLQSAEESQRDELCEELVKNLVAHSAIEKEIMYPACSEAMPDVIKRSEEEHGLVDVLLLKILDVETADDTFEAKIDVLKEMVTHHIEEEESELIPGASKALGDDRLEQMGEEMEARFNEVREEAPRPLIEESLSESLGIATKRRPAPRKRARPTARQAPRAKRATVRARASRAKAGRKSRRRASR